MTTIVQILNELEFLPRFGGGGSLTLFPAEGKMSFNVSLPVCSERVEHTAQGDWIGREYMREHLSGHYTSAPFCGRARLTDKQDKRIKPV